MSSGPEPRATQSGGIAVTIGIHHLEGYVVGPLIIGRATGLHPTVLILSVIVGTKLGGVSGAFLAGPFAAAIAGYVANLSAVDVPTEDPGLDTAGRTCPTSRS
ncbi:MAG: AI-2E family transporter [Acidimicrobiia bacterium]|nr:AI-2E family transporter [Acidimicrobiia bacterium]